MTARRPQRHPVIKLDVETETTAECVTCWRSWEAPSALGVGARHAAAFGHKVHAYHSNSVTYLGTRRTP